MDLAEEAGTSAFVFPPKIRYSFQEFIQKMLFTSESVTEGHPDKICDQISDAVLDDLLAKDPQARVAVECAVKSGIVFIFGEISTEAWANTEKIARDVIKKIGYDRAEYGFDYEACGVLVSVSEQSPDIALGLKEAQGHEQGAGDQGMMFGYACRETPALMPLPITLAHRLTRRLAELRHAKTLPFLRPDGKTQITVEYDDNGKPKGVHTVVVSTQHDENISLADLKKEVWANIVLPEIGDFVSKDTIFHCNPTGKFVLGGPAADSGLTGRKIVVDTYGGSCPHGGGCFSGKDPSKVDRSAAYAARYIAKNIVAAGLAEKCQIQLSYAIGIAAPVSVYVNSFGTGKLPDRQLENIVYEYFPVKPADIIKTLNLKTPIYQKTAVGGHFGREEFSWEKTDRASILRDKFL